MRRWAPARADHPEPDAPVRVLYIAGSGRCGSTLLDRMLGQTGGVFSAGEIRAIWHDGLVRDQRCGCGERLRDCEVWSEVIRHAFGSFTPDDARRMSVLEQRLRTRYWPLTQTGPTWRLFLERLEEYPERIEALYRAIRTVTGCEVIVDSSKDPVYGSVLASLGPVDFRMVHLVRDPRATSFSWQRHKVDPGQEGEAFVRFPPVFSTLMWMVLNHDSAGYGRRYPERYLRIRYEDLIRRPEELLGRIGDLTAFDFDPSIFVADDAVKLEATHSVGGNPNRFDRGTVRLRVDDEWRSSGRSSQRAIVTAMTAPLLRRFGYPIRDPSE